MKLKSKLKRVLIQISIQKLMNGIMSNFKWEEKNFNI